MTAPKREPEAPQPTTVPTDPPRRTEPLYRALARLVDARNRCLANLESAKQRNDKASMLHWAEMSETHAERAEALAKAYLPSGSGIDNGTQIDLERSRPDRLVLTTSFHHMNDGGCYDGWTEHDVVVTPSLQHGIDLRITGRDRNDVKGYLADVFHDALITEIDPYGA